MNAKKANWVEPVLALLLLASIVYPIVHLLTNAYLPQPFFYAPDDLWADWFNTAYFAYDKGTYDAWRTIYPPLSFIFLRIFTLERCYVLHDAADVRAGLPARGCDWWGLVSLHGFYLLAVGLAAYSFYKWDRKTALWRTIAIAIGFPFLDGLERGNLVIVSFICLMLAFGPILKSARWRAVAIGLAINFKVYLIASLAPLILRRRWRFVEWGLIATVLVYITSFAILGRGTPGEIYRNIVAFNEWQSEASDLLGIWYSTTFTPHLGLLTSSLISVPDLIGSRATDILLVFIPACIYSTQIAILLAAFATWLRPNVVPFYRVINLGLMLALITSEAGGYTQVYFIYLVFFEKFEGWGRKWAIVACYLLSPSTDIPIDTVFMPVVRDTYLWGKTVIVTYYVMLGPFFRPLIVLSVPFALSLVTIRQVWRDISENGWQFPWRFADKDAQYQKSLVSDVQS
jgi:hypothetical protein